MSRFFPSRRTAGWLAIAAIALLGAALWFSQGWLSNLARRELVSALENRFDATVHVQSLTIRLLPRVHVTGTGLELRHRGRTDIPPLIAIKQFAADAGLFEVLRQHISTVRVTGLTLALPPDDGPSQPSGDRDDRGDTGGTSGQPDRGQKPASQSMIGGLVIQDVIANQAVILLLPDKPDHQPLRFDISHLDVHHFQFDEPSSYTATLTNPKPKGDIACSGHFGPWQREDPGATPVDGHYRFTNVDLSTINGIGGTLSSEGEYDGRLASLRVKGTTDTPDFQLSSVGHPLPLETKFEALIDGTNGNTWLRHIDANLAGSPLEVSGAVVQEPKAEHRTIEVDVKTTEARLEDLLTLAVSQPQPALAGTLGLQAHLVIPPGDEDVVKRVALDGTFTISDGRFTRDGIQSKVDTLSRRGRGQPKDERIRNVLSTFSGTFDLHRGVLHLPRLAFSVNGAQVHLAGTYVLQSEALNFAGNLRLKAHLSETTTGVKSFFLKLLDPLFSKHGAGTYLPITVTGTV
ncbi:MAG TPA: AsmA-like C-terminal region-containing protein, partial [Vicinamibacterales bacterium]